MQEGSMSKSLPGAFDALSARVGSFRRMLYHVIEPETSKVALWGRRIAISCFGHASDVHPAQLKPVRKPAALIDVLSLTQIRTFAVLTFAIRSRPNKPHIKVRDVFLIFQ
jgi:hypothetical protein